MDGIREGMHPSEKKYYTIGDISKLYGIGADSLRYYERKGILHPIRGSNGFTVGATVSFLRGRE